MSMIGLIMLMGLVTKNAILLVDFTNQARREGMSRHQALLQAGTTRLRPIVMTTLAMIFGMLPLAFAIGAGAEMRAPMARAVIGGLITSTLLSLLVVPVVYTFLDDFRPSMLWGWAVLRRKAASHCRIRRLPVVQLVGELSYRLRHEMVREIRQPYGRCCLGLFSCLACPHAQLQQGTIVGSLVGPNGVSDQRGPDHAVRSARQRGDDRHGHQRAVPDLTNVAIGSYSLKAEAPPFEAVVQTLRSPTRCRSRSS